ncbi:MAG: hypothetical protein ACM3S1_00525 [Hyphomicrobiales bacterium]
MPAHCSCCGSPDALARLGSRSESGEWQVELCFACLPWLREVVEGARDNSPRLLASPTSNGRDLLFDDQCRLCRRIADRLSDTVECTSAGGGALPFPVLRLCPPCDAWLASLAGDGRSARGLATRAIDGDYGLWLHPNLRSLSVAVDISDEAARTTVLEVCREMDIPAASWRDAESPSVLFVEVPGRSFRSNDPRVRSARQVLIAPLEARAELVAALSPAVVDWLTLPVTPQQVTAALSRVLRTPSGGRAWEPAFALPVMMPVAPAPRALAFDVAPGADPFEVAWLLKRFARGYDELGVLRGRLLLVPRVSGERFAHVERRLARLLGARATIQRVAQFEERSRLHIAG